ncbi:MAG: ABC transporter substrate-binding protein [Treponema sp.]|nr:ABC transporter substrate-binding protein [Treponema sp.]
MKVNFVIVLCAVLAFGVSCSGKQKQAGSSSTGAAGTITVTDLAGREVTIKMPVKKISTNWAGTGGAFMTMSALLGKDVADYISSWDRDLQTYRFDMWEHYRSTIPALENIPIVGDFETNDLNLEMLIALKPDLVIWTLGVKQQAESTVEPTLAKAGIPIVYIDHHAETIENHSRSTRLLGKIFGKEERAEELVKFYVDNMNLITKRLSGIQNKPLVYVEVAYGGPEKYSNTFSDSYSWGSMIAKAGGTSLGEGKVEKFGALEAETVIAGKPDLIIFGGSYWPDIPESLRMGYLSSEDDTQRLLRNYLKRPGWNSLSAVKNKQVFAIYFALAFGMYDAASVAFLAKCIHPELFADIDPMAMLRDYYSRFMPYDISGVWMTQIE